jgi:hypothetical protein
MYLRQTYGHLLFLPFALREGRMDIGRGNGWAEVTVFGQGESVAVCEF